MHCCRIISTFCNSVSAGAPFIIIERSIHTHGVPRNSWLTVECEKSENDRGGGQRGGDDSGCWGLHWGERKKKVIGPDGGQERVGPPFPSPPPPPPVLFLKRREGRGEERGKKTWVGVTV